MTALRGCTFTLVLALSAVAACGPAKPASSTLAAPEPVPVYRESRHHLVFHNGIVRVLDVVMPPHDTSDFHVHANPLVGVTVQDARTWRQGWTIGVHYVVAEWLGGSGIESAALIDTPTRRLVKEGAGMRIDEITLAPHQSSDEHAHPAPGLTVLGTSGALVEEGGSPAAAGGTGAGRWWWREAGYHHVLRNEGSAPLTVYEIDWRQDRP